MKILQNFLIFLLFMLNHVKCQYNWSNENENNLKIEDVFDDFELPLESYIVPDDPSESEFCNSSYRCYFKHLNKTIIVDEHSRLKPDCFLILKDMKAVIIYPSCVEFIEISNASYVQTATQNSTEPDSCKTSLDIFGSNVTRIEHGVETLILFKSYAESISLKNQSGFTIMNSTVLEIEKLDYSRYDGAIFRSYIKKMKFVEAYQYKVIENSHIHILGAPATKSARKPGIILYGVYLQIVNTTIDYLYSSGIETTTGGTDIFLENVHIKHCFWHGIYVEQGSIMMINVTVEKAHYAFLYIGYYANIVVRNVTVEGIPVNDEDIKYWPVTLMTKPGKTQVSLNDSYHCNSIEDEVICNYIDAKNQNIEFNVVALYGENPSIKNITIKEIKEKTARLYLDDHLCGVHLTLDNVNALYKVMSSNASDLCLDRPSIVKIYNSHIYNSYDINNCNIKILEIRNSYITGYIPFSRNSSIDSITAINSNLVSSFLDINLKKESTITIKDSHGDFFGTYTEGVVEFRNSTLRLHNFTIHNEDGRMSSVNNVSFSDTRTEIILEKGNLTIDFLTIHGIKPRNDATNSPEIYIGKEGKLYIVGDIPSELKDHKAIYAYDLNQIVLEKGVPRSILNHFVKLIEEPKPEEKIISTVIGTHNCTTPPFVPSFQIARWTCDYTDYQNVHVDLKIERSDAKYYEIRGAHSVTIYQCCVFEVIIVDSKNISSAMSPYSQPCTFRLKVRNSEIYKLTENIYYLDLHNSTAKFISFEYEIRGIKIIFSHVDVIQGLTWTESKSYFTRSTFGNISRLNAKFRSSFFYCKIEIIDNNGILIDDHVTFAETNITEIKSKGININNNLIFENVIIDKVEDSAFTLTEKAELIMSNVTIKQGTLGFMEIHDSSRVKFHNVTLMGQSLYIKITHGFVENTTAPTITPTKTRLTTTPPATNEFNENTTALGHTECQPVERKPSNAIESKMWIGIVYGFIFGIIVAVIIVSVITMKRSGRLLPNPRVRWRRRDSQNELINVEELQSTEATSDGRVPENIE